MAENTLHSLATELDETIRKEYVYALTAVPPEFPKYTKKEKWDQLGGMFVPVIRRKEGRSIGPAPERPEGEDTVTQQIEDGRTKDLDDPPVFSTGLSFTKHKLQMGIGSLSSTKRVAELLADATRLTMENFWIALLNDADDTGAADEIIGFDGKPPISTAHELLGSTANPSNKLAVATSVTYTALNDMVTKIARTVNEEGKYHNIYKLNQLYIPVEEELNALEALKSAGRPDTVQRADNVLDSRMHFGLSQSGIVTLMYMTADRWFGVDATRHMNFRYVLEDAGIKGPIVDDMSDSAVWLRTFWIHRANWGWRGLFMADRPT